MLDRRNTKPKIKWWKHYEMKYPIKNLSYYFVILYECMGHRRWMDTKKNIVNQLNLLPLKMDTNCAKSKENNMDQ